jgi:putative Holliday junction resolvase
MILSLDLGGRRVGVAKTDESEFLASALPMIPIERPEDLVVPLGKLIAEFKPRKVVVGYPITLKGEVGIAAQNTGKQVEFLKSQFPETAFELWDERLTSKEAEVYLRSTDQSRRKRKAKIDSLSAEILLQGYLDAKKGN